MPITLEKILSPTADTEFDFLGETVHVTFAPLRYTGAMQDLAQRFSDEDNESRVSIAEARDRAAAVIAEAGSDPEALTLANAQAAEIQSSADERERALDLRERRQLRESLASDGDGKGGPPGLLVSWDVLEGRKPLAPTRANLDKLPDVFLRLVFVSLAWENQPDPQKAPTSDEP